jgi:valyl-tRNA synthetase
MDTYQWWSTKKQLTSKQVKLMKKKMQKSYALAEQIWNKAKLVADNDNEYAENYLAEQLRNLD